MKRTLSIAICLAMLAIPCLAQDSASSAQPSREDVLRFMDLMHVRATMDQLLEGMKKGMKAGAEAGFKQRIEKPTPEQLEAVNKLTDAVFKDFPVDEIINSAIPIYQRHITKSDLDAIVAFYSSPVGQRLLKEQPAIMAESMQAGQDIMLRKIPELHDRLNSKVAELADQELRKTNPPPKSSQ